MNAKDKGLQRVAELIESIRILRSESPRSTEGVLQVAKEELWHLLTSAIQTTRSLCSDESPHFQELTELRQVFRNGEPFDSDKFIGILRAVEDDLRSGMLVSIQEIVTAEVFDDLADMATYLLEQGYQLPSVSIAGAVLEDTLRKLCHKHKVAWVGDSAINKLNTELYKANVYDKAQFGQVDAWCKLRNKVDHGDFKDANEVDRNDVRRMIAGLRDFVIKYLT
ncbi:MAG: hypothetical protein HY257_07825 [Chloroflexi bacterium]|nr:hypothetical protein [Chloroflexota bacterium]